MNTPTPTPRPALKATGVRRRDARRPETELATLWARAERAEAERDSIKQEIEMVEHRAYRAEVERDQLRAEVERLKTCGITELAAVNSSVLEYCKHWEARAERAEADAAAYLKRAESFRKIGDEAEAELAKERARLDWLIDQLRAENATPSPPPR